MNYEIHMGEKHSIFKDDMADMLQKSKEMSSSLKMETDKCVL